MSYKEIASKTAVIITVYNREDLVKNAVGSIVNQTLRPGGIIVVDDASTDNSGQAAVEAGDGLVTLVTLPVNMGAGVAKRAGFQKAKDMGFEFVMCLDSDDLYEKEAIEIMSTAMERYDADLVACSVRNVWLDDDDNIEKERIRERKGLIVEDDESIRRLIPSGYIDIFANAKMVKIDATLNPPYSDRRYQEDTESTCWWLVNSHKVIILPYALYVYNHRKSGQLTNDNDSTENAIATLMAIRSMLRTLGTKKARELSSEWRCVITREMNNVKPSELTNIKLARDYDELKEWKTQLGFK